jgi:aryl-alcohol dehydrogenase-like predicted oxidoreductase
MREFGGTGIRASVVGLGCNNFGIYQNAAQAVAVVRKALDVGINFLDMAADWRKASSPKRWARDART